MGLAMSSFDPITFLWLLLVWGAGLTAASDAFPNGK